MIRIIQLSPSATAIVTSAALLLAAPFARADEFNGADEQGDLNAREGTRLPARAGDFSLKIEPGLAFPLSRPQSQLFDLGGSQTLKALWALSPYFDIGPSVSVLALPAESTSSTELGTAWTFGGGVRLKRPHHVPDNDSSYAISPWLDVDALFVRTDDLNRAGFAGAAGLAVSIGESRSYWLGPFVRYLQILQSERGGFDTKDAKILSVGLSLDLGSGVKREPPPPPAVTPAEPTAAPRVVEKESFVCPDRDKDGVPDEVDHCPDAPGKMEHSGCPPYAKLVVKKDKLELKEKLYFAHDEATLQEASYPVLDEVVVALKDNKGFRVQVQGHSSSEGAEAHNQTLSEARAQAVLDYLVAQGVPKERIGSKGFSSSVPLDTNETAAGRENNRRVEFVVHFIIVDGRTP